MMETVSDLIDALRIALDHQSARDVHSLSLDPGVGLIATSWAI